MNIEQLAAVGLRDDAQRTATIGQNLSNALTPGYKAGRSIPAAFSIAVNVQGPAPSVRIEPVAASVGALNASMGNLQATNVATDVAIEGEAWFELQAGDGHRFTRVGRLSIGRDGVLLGPAKLPILGEAGPIHLDNAPFSITSTGEVMQAGASAGVLRRVRIEHPGAMVAAGDGTYLQGASGIADARANDPIRSGVLEASNVDSPGEMVRLTETVRHFESLQRIVQGYDEVLGATIRKLGEF